METHLFFQILLYFGQCVIFVLNAQKMKDYIFYRLILSLNMLLLKIKTYNMFLKN